jgi:hypothetical protein
MKLTNRGVMTLLVILLVLSSIILYHVNMLQRLLLDTTPEIEETITVTQLRGILQEQKRIYDFDTECLMVKLECSTREDKTFPCVYPWGESADGTIQECKE